MGASNDGKTKSALLLGLDERSVGGSTWSGAGLLLALDASELFGIGENEVHVLVKCEHLSDHLASVVHGDSHPVVDLFDISFSLEDLRSLFACARMVVIDLRGRPGKIEVSLCC